MGGAGAHGDGTGGEVVSDTFIFVVFLLGVGVFETSLFAFGLWLARRMGIRL